MRFPRCNLHFSNITVHFTAGTCLTAEDQAASCVSTCGDSNPEQPRCQQQLEFPAEQIHVGASAHTHTLPAKRIKAPRQLFMNCKALISVSPCRCRKRSTQFRRTPPHTYGQNLTHSPQHAKSTDVRG